MNTSETPIDTIVLEKFVRPGDLVAYHFDDKEQWATRRYAEGKQFRVLGHTTWLDYRTLVWSTPEKPPGIYKRFGAPILEDVDTGETVQDTISLHHLYFVDRSIRNEDRRVPCHTTLMCDEGERIGDLPETTYEIGDRVRWTDPTRFNGKLENERATIGDIEYRNIGRMCDDGITPLRIYSVRLDDGASTYAGENEIELVERGNYYHWTHDRSMLKFRDLAEEVGFYKSIGFSKELRNDGEDGYSWSQKDAVAAIRADKACGYVLDRALFSGTRYVRVFGFPSLPELHERMRAATLEGHPIEKDAELDPVNHLKVSIENGKARRAGEKESSN